MFRIIVLLQLCNLMSLEQKSVQKYKTLQISRLLIALQFRAAEKFNWYIRKK